MLCTPPPHFLQLSELKKSLTAVQSEVQEALQRASTALNNEQQARRDCQEQVCLDYFSCM